MNFLLMLSRDVGCFEKEEDEFTASEEGNSTPKTELTTEIGKKIDKLKLFVGLNIRMSETHSIGLRLSEHFKVELFIEHFHHGTVLSGKRNI